MQKKLYQITDKVNSRKIAEFLSKDGQLLLPFLDLICNTEQAVDELIDVVGKAAIEAVLLLSARQRSAPLNHFLPSFCSCCLSVLSEAQRSRRAVRPAPSSQ